MRSNIFLVYICMYVELECIKFQKPHVFIKIALFITLYLQL